MLKRFAWLALFACAPLYAAPHLDDQRLQQLANDPFWLSLGHYEAGKVSGWRSYVSDKKFFLAPDGAHHPDAELKATVDALYAPASLGEKHAQCVYPARTRWLKAQLQLNDLPALECKEFTQWFKDVAPHSAVMIFPAAYLNSPSSMFGHTLLRIDQADVQSNNTALLSYAINFGAYIEGSDNSILYAWKGLMGGYPGLFALVPYQEKLSEYRSLENRDLWEYRLNLTEVETKRMVEHVWELKQIQFDYFFFDENCSYRLLELLQVARPGLRLTEQFPLTAIPTDTVKAVKDAGLVEKIDYRPSRERELLERAKPLDSDEQQWVLNISDDQKQLQEPAFKALPRERQALIVDAAYRLGRYRANGLERDATRSQRSFELLRAINQNPAPDLKITPPGLPENGHESRTWQAGIGTRGDKAFGEYGLRMAYHDLNDNAEGFPPWRADRNFANEIAPVRGQSLATPATGPGHHPLADATQCAAATLVVASHRRPGTRAGQARRRNPGGPRQRRRRWHLATLRRHARLRPRHRARGAQQRLQRSHLPRRRVQHRRAVEKPVGQPEPGSQGRFLHQRRSAAQHQPQPAMGTVTQPGPAPECPA